MKNIYYLAIILSLISSLCYSQSPLWSLPNNSYSVFGTQADPLPTPFGVGIGWPVGYDGRSPSVAHNVQHDAIGALLFFIVDGHIFDKDGLLISEIMNGEFGTAEVLIIPVPNKCNRYYIVGSEYYAGSFSAYPNYFVLDLEIPADPNQYPAPFGKLITPSNSSLVVPGNWDDVNGKDAACQFACTPLLQDGSRKLFILSEENLLSYRVDENGIQFENFSHFIDYRYSGLQTPLMNEMELFYNELNERVLIAFAWKSFAPSFFYNNPLMVPYHAQLNSTPNAIAKPNVSDPTTWFVRPESWLAVVQLDLSAGNPIFVEEKRHLFFEDLTLPNGSLIPNDITGLEFLDLKTLILSKTATSIDPENLIVLNLLTPTLEKLSPHPVFTNEATFSRSFIEKGIDDRFYLHNGTDLARFNAITSNWIPSLLQFNYAVTTQPNNPTPPYFLQDQIDNENSLTLAQNQNVCCQNYEYSTPNNDLIINTGGAITWSPNNNPFNNSPNTVIVNGSITIMPGTNLTISNLQFYFKENTRVTIERGASLTMNNTLFTSEECATYLWQGVIVKGNPALAPNFINQGSLIMHNNSEISNAIRGVRNFGVIDVYDPNTQTTSQQPDFGNSGGQLYIDQSTFRNNKKDVEMYPYSQSHQGYFRRTTFITDAVLNDGTSCDTHLSLFGVRNIKVEGCKFRNTVPQQFAFIQRGFGITAADASFSIDKNLPTGTTSEFENLYYGISASAVNPINNTSVKNTLFKECHRGLYFNNIDYSIVVNNVFEVGETFTTVNTGTSYGAYFQNSTGYKISDNVFNSDHHLTQDVRGLLINNSNENGQSADVNNVVRNNFDRLRCGSWAFNANAKYINSQIGITVFNSSGLTFKCNGYKDITQGDIMITNGGIKPQQGSCISSTSGANNQFSAQFASALNYWNGNPNVTPFSSQYFYNPSIPLSHNPLVINTFNTQKTGCTQAYNPLAKGNCNSAIVTGPLIVLKSLSDSLKTAGEAKENFYTALDAYVNNQWSSYENGQLSVGNLKNNLETKSPYLSVDILEAIVLSNIAPGIKKQLLLDNSPLPESIVLLVQQSNMPNGIKNQILNGQNGGTNPRVIVDAEASDLLAESKAVLNEAIRFYIHDTISVNGLDSAIILLKSREELVYRKQLADAYIENNEFNNAQHILDSLKLVDNGAHLEFAKMRELLIAFEQCQERGFRIEHDSLQRTELESIVLGDPFKRECVSAQVLFEMVTKIRVDEEIPFYTVPKSYTPAAQNLTTVDQMASIYVYPNPAHDFLTVELMNESDKAMITIYSILGTVMKTIAINQSIQQIDVSDLQAGIYLVTSTLSDGTINTERIVIER